MPTTNRPNGVTEYTWGAKRSRKKILLIVSTCLIIIAAGVGGFLYFSKGEDPVSATTGNSNTAPGQATVARVIDGVSIPQDRANLFPVGVMIENLVSARPQSGLGDANVVYEALAEGGITRFLALFATGYEVPKIGPVRSARSYYLDWALEYGALYAHIGGSPQALTDIKTKKVFDLNQFAYSQYFWRDTERQRPHNLYTSSAKLALAVRDRKAPEQGNFSSWAFKAEAALASRPAEAKSVEIDFSSFSYKVIYDYNREKNAYMRNQAGQPHVDSEGKQISAKNVIVQYTKATLADGDGRLAMTTVGEGKAIIFRDGVAVQGTWKKTSPEGRTQYLDSSGKPVELIPGTIWVEIVPTDREIVYN
ncbi:MAG: DUF3048 domain-containing protein [Patescibacteria group bacterium]|jgi:hypothetical protein